MAGAGYPDWPAVDRLLWPGGMRAPCAPRWLVQAGHHGLDGSLVRARSTNRPCPAPGPLKQKDRGHTAVPVQALPGILPPAPLSIEKTPHQLLVLAKLISGMILPEIGGVFMAAIVAHGLWNPGKAHAMPPACLPKPDCSGKGKARVDGSPDAAMATQAGYGLFPILRAQLPLGILDETLVDPAAAILSAALGIAKEGLRRSGCCSCSVSSLLARSCRAA